MEIGIALVIVVVVTALLIAWKAARSVDRFREEHHESFLGDENQLPRPEEPRQ